VVIAKNILAETVDRLVRLSGPVLAAQAAWMNGASLSIESITFVGELSSPRADYLNTWTREVLMMAMAFAAWGFGGSSCQKWTLLLHPDFDPFAYLLSVAAAASFLVFPVATSTTNRTSSSVVGNSTSKPFIPRKMRATAQAMRLLPS
jgi:hypothetical protein